MCVCVYIYGYYIVSYTVYGYMRLGYTLGYIYTLIEYRLRYNRWSPFREEIVLLCLYSINYFQFNSIYIM